MNWDFGLAQTCGDECALEELPEVVEVEGAVFHLHIHVASHAGLHHVQVGQPKLVQLFCQVAVGGIGLVIFYGAKLTIR